MLTLYPVSKKVLNMFHLFIKVDKRKLTGRDPNWNIKEFDNVAKIVSRS